MISTRAPLKIESNRFAVEQKAVTSHVGSHLTKQLKDCDDNDQRQKDIQIMGP
jgi:hypothetical protein